MDPSKMFKFRGRKFDVASTKAAFDAWKAILPRVKGYATRLVGLHDGIQEADTALFRAVQVLLEGAKSGTLSNADRTLLKESLQMVVRFSVLMKFSAIALYAMAEADDEASFNLGVEAMEKFEAMSLTEMVELGMFAEEDIPQEFIEDVMVFRRFRDRVEKQA